MGLVAVRFLAQPDSLWAFTAPMAVLFVLFGWVRPTLSLYPLILALPLLLMVPHVRGVANFSLIEVAWWSVCIGALVRRSVAPKRERSAPAPTWPVLTLLTLVICGSAAVRLARSFLWNDGVVWQLLWDALGDFFRLSQESRLYPLRAAVIWLEGLAFLALVRRNATRAGFQQRVRVLLMISLTLVVSISLHQLVLGLALGADAPQVLSDWQVKPDWVPGTVTDLLPGLRRIHATWPDVNSFASYLLMAFAMVLSAVVLGRSIVPRAMLLTLGLAAALVLLLTFSRIAWLWFPVTIAVWWRLSRVRSRQLWDSMERRRNRRWVTAGFAAALALIALVLFAEPVSRAVLAFPETRIGERLNVILKGRLTLWETALRMAQRHPLLGEGWGSFYAESLALHRPEAFATSQGAPLWNPAQENAHSQYLQTLAEIGLLGVALMGLMIGQWLRVCLRALAWGRGEQRWSVRGLVAAVAALGGTLLTGHALLLIEVLLLFWLAVGLAFVKLPRPSRPVLRPTPLGWRRATVVAAGALTVLFGVRVWQCRNAPDLADYGVGFTDPITESSVVDDFRWTREHASLVVRNLDGELRFSLSNARPDREPVTVDLFVEGALIDSFSPPDHHWWPVRHVVDVPPGEPYRIDFQVHFPPESDWEDQGLGVRISGLRH
jgi:hypothetical protein